MAKSLDELIATASDFDLCCEVSKRIDRRYPDDVSATEFTEEERVVQLVMLTWGIIDNGGFNYLFEADIVGDPFYELCAQAYETIGSIAAAEAFRKALAQFPNSKPPTDRKERIRHYRRGSGDKRGEIDTAFFHADDEIRGCLAKYIRSHVEAFRHLDQPLPARARPAKAKRRRKRLTGGVDFSQLPHWARIAFAARCARRVMFLYREHWPRTPEKYPNALSKAVALAEQSASAGEQVEGLKEASLGAMLAAGAPMATVYGFPHADPTLGDGNEASLVSTVANSARSAVDAARKLPDDSEFEAMQAWGFARSALETTENHDALSELYGEFVALKRLARRLGWTHHTVVPLGIFDRLDEIDEDEEERPPWWKFWK